MRLERHLENNEQFEFEKNKMVMTTKVESWLAYFFSLTFDFHEK